MVCHFAVKTTRSLVGPLMPCQSIVSNELSQPARSACRVPQPPRELVIVLSMYIGTARIHSYTLTATYPKLVHLDVIYQLGNC